MCVCVCAHFGFFFFSLHNYVYYCKIVHDLAQANYIFLERWSLKYKYVAPQRMLLCLDYQLNPYLFLDSTHENDENQQALQNPLHVPVGSITRARSKKIKEALNGLIQEILADSNTGHSKLGPKEDEGLINLIQAIEG